MPIDLTYQTFTMSCLVGHGLVVPTISFLGSISAMQFVQQ
ncbi:hypothetical protein Pint_20357 [Pistacia integerrima]|uniref:Uncharacterized protein n=1 Tax=Pistacia integerrima TaxID=434235 RepID=A0ACC0XCT0_9ROSI|nr:hypothetical protein Pint_20357 [Pistacia integerrima]